MAVSGQDKRLDKYGNEIGKQSNKIMINIAKTLWIQCGES